MSEQASLLPLDAGEEASAPRHETGIVPAQEIRWLVDQKVISATEPIGEDQIQPASMDLRLGPRAYRVRASFLPNPGARVADKLDALSTHEVDLKRGAVLEKGCVYIIPLLESVRFTKRMFGFANPRSSTGRLDIFTRLITDHAVVFDQVPGGLQGPALRRGFAAHFRHRGARGQPSAAASHPPRLPARDRHRDPPPERGGAAGRHRRRRRGREDADFGGTGRHGRPQGRPRLAVDRLQGQAAHRPDRCRRGRCIYDPLDYWDPIQANREGTLILDPEAFYVLVSKEAVTIPPDHAAEMIPFNPLQGAFRVHYAGFFDPGFGHGRAGGQGARAVLEVRSYEVPFVLEHGQIVARLVYERLRREPDRLYGRDIGSSYQQQGLALSRHFRRE